MTGGTDTHLIAGGPAPKGVKGNATEKALGRAHITCQERHPLRHRKSRRSPAASASANPAGTTRGFGEAEFRLIGQWITEVVDGLAANGEDGNAEVEAAVRAKVEALCEKFPIYPGL